VETGTKSTGVWSFCRWVFHAAAEGQVLSTAPRNSRVAEMYRFERLETMLERFRVISRNNRQEADHDRVPCPELRWSPAGSLKLSTLNDPVVFDYRPCSRNGCSWRRRLHPRRKAHLATSREQPTLARWPE
jgi:uncharacterized membrane protein